MENKSKNAFTVHLFLVFFFLTPKGRTSFYTCHGVSRK
jgi:hypothetical protein